MTQKMYDEFTEALKKNEETISEVIRAYIKEYIKESKTPNNTEGKLFI
jgi:metal-responsive CopG/Arc/MetJ family transcriptional regulator